MRTLDFYLTSPNEISNLTDDEQLALYQQLSSEIKGLESKKVSLQSQKDLLQQQLKDTTQQLLSLSNTSNMDEFTQYFTNLKQQFVSEQQELLKLVSEVENNERSTTSTQ